LTASSEAQSAFGDGAVYLEKYLSPVKHIEMQVLCDRHGNVVCAGERECSIQRRNQKLLEESPSPAISDDVRRKMTEITARAARTVGYVGAGTVEYLFDRDGNFYFLEMNTRLQVEHPVTETVTGIDLVKWQIRIAAGQPLSFSQEDVVLKGNAIECRINSENPSLNFRPSSGPISLLHIPGGPWVRFDTALYQDYVVPPFYDSLIGKLIVHAPRGSDPQDAGRAVRAGHRGRGPQRGAADGYTRRRGIPLGRLLHRFFGKEGIAYAAKRFVQETEQPA